MSHVDHLEETKQQEQGYHLLEDVIWEKYTLSFNLFLGSFIFKGHILEKNVTFRNRFCIWQVHDRRYTNWYILEIMPYFNNCKKIKPKKWEFVDAFQEDLNPPS